MKEKKSNLMKFVPGSSERALHLAALGKGPGVLQQIRGLPKTISEEVGRGVSQQMGREADRILGRLPEMAEEVGKRFVEGGRKKIWPHVTAGTGVGLLAGGAAGYTVRELQQRAKSKKEGSMEGHKFAGVTLDHYDDCGETLKSIFPTVNELPDMIKSANVQPKDKLPNEAFALIMIDQGYVFRKYACADPGTTAISAIYFMEHGDKLPEEAQKTAATNLVRACVHHGIMPPAEMTKVADLFPGGLADNKSGYDKDQMSMGAKVEMEHTRSPAQAREISRDHLEETPDYYTRLAKMERGAPGREKEAQVVDVTGKRPTPRVVDTRPVDENLYAVKLADGSLHYPIDTWDRIKTAEAYFQDERIRMDPEIRRQYAVKLARQAYFVGYPLDKDIVDLGALSYHNDGHLKHASEMRKAAFPGGGAEHEFLDDMFEKRSGIQPEVYAECLKRFDMMNGLDKGWDRVILDPWASTFGVKTAAVAWENGADRVTEEELINLARNNSGHLDGQFSEYFTLEFLKDPMTLFNSLPDPQKRIIARMAVDLASKGSSEFMPTKNDDGRGLDAPGKKFKTTFGS